MRGGRGEQQHIAGEEEARRGGVKDGGMCEEMRTVCESDGSLHLPLSSRRTNYKVMDSRLITRATRGFKLAGSWCRAWCDEQGQEGRQERRRGGAWVQREDEVM